MGTPSFKLQFWKTNFEDSILNIQFGKYKVENSREATGNDGRQGEHQILPANYHGRRRVATGGHKNTKFCRQIIMRGEGLTGGNKNTKVCRPMNSLHLPSEQSNEQTNKQTDTKKRTNKQANKQPQTNKQTNHLTTKQTSSN